MSSDAKQNSLRLAFGVHNAPKPAPSHVLRMVDSEHQALAVAMLAGGHKLAYVAACVGKSESYVSLLRAGKRPIPERLVGPLCAATGSLLLKQYRDLQRALDGQGESYRLAELLRAA